MTALVCLSVFDETLGPVLEWREGDMALSEALEQRVSEELPFLSLSENASSISAVRSEAGDHAATTWLCLGEDDVLFGASAMVSEKRRPDFKRAPGSGGRDARQQAVTVLSRFPAFDVLEAKARALSVLLFHGRSSSSFDDDDDLDRDDPTSSTKKRHAAREVARDLVERCRVPSGGDFAGAVPGLEAFVARNPEVAVRAVRSLLVGGSVVFFSQKASVASRAVVAVASLMPAFVSLGWSTFVTPDTAPAIGAKAYKWTKLQLPRKTARLWRPATSVASLDELFNAPSCCVGCCNAMLARRLAEKGDVAVVDLDAGTWTCPSKKTFAASLDPHSKKLLGDLREHALSQDGPSSFVGSASWVRRRFEEWLCAVRGDDASSGMFPNRWLQLFHADRDSSGGGQRILPEDLVTSPRTARKEGSLLFSSSPDANDDDDDRQERYEGAVDEEGRRHGVGRLYDSDDKLVYSGDFAHGVRQGHGEAWTRCESPRRRPRHYVGDFAGDQPHGRGREDVNEGEWVYEGAFVRGRSHGSGELRYVPPERELDDVCPWRYVGEFFEGELQGAGSLECLPELCGVRKTEKKTVGVPFVKHVGEWFRGARHGVGHSEFAKEFALASGEWRDDRFVEGVVKKRTEDSERQGRFVGDFLLDGFGSLTTCDGDVFEGHFARGEMDPESEWTAKYADGRRYAGKLRDGVPFGAGLCRYASGDCYTGDFQCGLRDGSGTLVRADGSEPLTGLWRCDNFVGKDVATPARGGLSGTTFLFSRSNSSIDDDNDTRGVFSGGDRPSSRRRTSPRKSASRFLTQEEDDDENLDDDEDAVVVDLTPGLSPRESSSSSSEQQHESSRKNDKASPPKVKKWAPPTRPNEVRKAPRSGFACVRYANGDLFEGHFKNGVRSGRGVLTEAESGNSYDGDWARGRRHGQGTFETGDGRFVFVGEWKEGKRVKGVATLKDRCTYSGEWRGGLFHGVGKLVDAAKNVYEGEFQFGRRHGAGKASFRGLDASHTYKGEFRDGERSGHGSCDYSDGTSYAGEWLADKWHGQGTVSRLEDGLVLFEGCFEHGRRHGWGLERDEDTFATREGTWQNGRPDESHDKWTIAYADGAAYNGALKDGLPHDDHAVWKKPSGELTLYNGAFRDGKKAGTGFALFRNGQTYQGDFLDDHIALDGDGVLTFPDGTTHVFSKTMANPDDRALLPSPTTPGFSFPEDDDADVPPRQCRRLASVTDDHVVGQQQQRHPRHHRDLEPPLPPPAAAFTIEDDDGDDDRTNERS